jgi:hypothetical protein
MMRAAEKATRLLLSLLALALAALPATALESPEYLRVTWGVLGESFLDPALTTVGSADRAPPFSINYNFGAGVSMPFTRVPGLAFAPSGDMYFYNAQYTTAGQVVPTDEAFTSAFVLGLILNAPLAYSYAINDQFNITASVGLAFDLRVAFTTDSAKASYTPLMNSYLWDKGRFLMPSTSIRGEYKLTDRVGFGFTARMFWPIYNLWTEEGFGFFDQGKYFFDLVIRYKLGSKPAAPQNAPTSP